MSVWPQGLDPEFLAALPPDIRAELLAQQRTERRRLERARIDVTRAREEAATRAAAAAAAPSPAPAGAPGEGGAAAEAGAAEVPAPPAGAPAAATGPADVDMATLLATFPPDVREDVLLSMDEPSLATLPQTVQMEARVLRQRYRAAIFQQVSPGSR